MMTSQGDHAMPANEGVHWKLKRNEAKGRHTEAKVEIKRGTCIIEEEPLLQFTHERYDLFNEDVFYGAGEYSGGPAVLEKFERLDYAGKGKYTQLLYDDEKTEDWLTAQGAKRQRGPITLEQWQCFSRCQRNAFDLSADEAVETGKGEKLLVVFHKISFFNHSCKPNAVLKWDPERKCGMVHALCLIRQNDEIRFNYNPSLRDTLAIRSVRQSLCQRNWNFACRCALCSRNATLSGAMDAQRSKAWRDWEILRKLPWPSENEALDLAETNKTWPDGHKDTGMDDDLNETVVLRCASEKVKATHKGHRRIEAYFNSVIDQFKALHIEDTSV